MRAGIIGNGFIAKKHKEAILKMGWEYVGAYDVVPERSEISLEDLIEKADVIHICTPNVFHHQLLPKDKKLIIEKPVAIHSSLVPDIDAAVCYQRRYDKQAVLMKQLIDEESPQLIKVNIFVPRDPAYWECWRGDKSMSGGGALMNIGIHYLDLLQWWFGKGEIIEAKLGYFQRGVEESAYVKYKFGETEVEFHLNARHNVRKIEFIVFWENYSAIYDVDEATHYDVLKGFIEGNYVTPKEAAISLKMVEDIYARTT